MERLTALKALVLANCGSRREMVSAIKDGRVLINNTVVTSFKQELAHPTDILLLDRKKVVFPIGSPLYFMLNKPVGVLCATKDARGRHTIMDFLPSNLRTSGLHPVGRLDIDSCGLLIITNDGNLTYQLTHPRFEKEKEYLISLSRSLTTNDLKQLEHGLLLSDGLTAPSKVRRGQTDSDCYITLHEGRKRQIRRMFATLGYSVISLMRIREGQLHLGDLPAGKYRPLSKHEITLLH
ncbi:MAG: rRNA pseudouridine synthase [Dehalococcoidia bacterium]|nr:rRNA pseudouridine synthase [Dehalococcoidia bacterium]